jgi:hypothetical protein
VLVTPEQAASWLSMSGSLSPDTGRVAVLAAEMLAGRWQPERSLLWPVVLSNGGLLSEGQHRLAAIVAAGVPVQIWVQWPHCRFPVLVAAATDQLRVAHC